MKNLFFIFFWLSIGSLFGQNPILQENWDAIVDHTNATVTSCYIEKLHISKKLNKEESEYYLNTLKKRLNNSSINSPIAFDSLEIYLNHKFKLTFENVSFKINEIKQGPRELDTLFGLMETIFIDVKQDSLIKSESISNLRTEINEYLHSQVIQDTQDVNSLKVLDEKPIEERGESILNLSNIIIAILVILIIFFIINSIKTGRKIQGLNNDKIKLKMSLKHKESQIDGIDGYESKIRKLERKISSLENELLASKNNLKQNFDITSNENQATNTITWENPELDPKHIPTSFYAGKPNPNKAFTQTTKEIEEQETVFKFTYCDDSKTTAEFEVVLASDFMKRQIINSPDDFLYRVCNNANSNHEFQREIKTERKGLARLVNGDWVVDENGKAFIKFQ